MKFAGFQLWHHGHDLRNRCGGPEVVLLFIDGILRQRQVEASKPFGTDRAVAGPRLDAEGGEPRITMRATFQQGRGVDRTNSNGANGPKQRTVDGRVDGSPVFTAYGTLRFSRSIHVYF